METVADCLLGPSRFKPSSPEGSGEGGPPAWGEKQLYKYRADFVYTEIIMEVKHFM